MYGNSTCKTRLILTIRRIAPGCIAGLWLALALLWFSSPAHARDPGPINPEASWFSNDSDDTYYQGVYVLMGSPDKAKSRSTR